MIQHTGTGHLIAECRLDLERVKHDLQDVKGKLVSLLEEGDLAKTAIDAADKRLTAMCNKQSNKLEIAYRSLINTLEVRR